MRAIYHPFDSHDSGESVIINGDAAHHLNVVRVRANETILLLNGKGMRLVGTIAGIQKNSVEIKIEKTETCLPRHSLSLAIANPKKDAFEDILKLSVELGIIHIFPLSSDFSQYDYAPSERVQRILESALIQSNNPFFPEIHPQSSLKEFLSTHQSPIVFFNSQKGLPLASKKVGENKTILIGPEGGFSSLEVDAIKKFPQLHEIHLATPIMRAPTAVASSVGYLLGENQGPE